MSKPTKKVVREIEPLDIDLKLALKEDYEKERARFISNYKRRVPSTREYHPGGFFSLGYYTGRDSYDEPDVILGEAKWKGYYPKGYDDWMNSNSNELTSYGQKLLIEKINEIIAYINHTTHK